MIIKYALLSVNQTNYIANHIQHHNIIPSELWRWCIFVWCILSFFTIPGKIRFVFTIICVFFSSTSSIAFGKYHHLLNYEHIITVHNQQIININFEKVCWMNSNDSLISNVTMRLYQWQVNVSSFHYVLFNLKKERRNKYKIN